MARANQQTESNGCTDRGRLAAYIIVSLFVLMGLAAAAIITVLTKLQPLKEPVGLADLSKFILDILNPIFPIVSGALGSVLAFYFADRNTQRVQDLVETLSPQQRLESAKVADVLSGQNLHKFDLKSRKFEELKIDVDLLAFMRASDTRCSRLPILDGGGKLVALFHESALDQALVTVMRARRDQAPAIEAITVADWIAAGVDVAVAYGPDSVGYCSEFATLAQAKEAMESTKAAGRRAQDVIVTDTGGKGGRVIGLVTNVDIARRAFEG